MRSQEWDCSTAKGYCHELGPEARMEKNALPGSIADHQHHHTPAVFSRRHPSLPIASDAGYFSIDEERHE